MPQATSGWTVDTAMAAIKTEIQSLRDSIKSDIHSIHDAMDEMDKRNEQRFQAQEKAIDKDAVASEKRFEGVNEFRQTLTDQAATFALKEQVDVQFKSLDAKIDTLAGLASTATGRNAGLSDGAKILIGIVGLLLSLLSAGSLIYAFTK